MVASGQYYHAEAGGTERRVPIKISSPCNLCVLCVFVVCVRCIFFTTETQRTQWLHREEFFGPRVVLTGHHSEDESFNFRNVRPERKNCTRRCAVARSFA